MGYLKNKYTKEYYTGRDSKGNLLKYGATSSSDEKGNYILREHDYLILKKIDFKNKNVLALGCGRAEELIFAVENGADIKNSVGVDFSSAAIKIAKKSFKDKKLESPIFYTSDALDFITDYLSKINNSESKKFDVVIMFDFVEHVPREELSKVLQELKSLLKDKSILALNTPAYKYDNDIIKEGYNEKNQIDSIDTSDLIPETKGMHCNKYSLISLQRFMENQGLINLTEAHYFVRENRILSKLKNISFYDRWNFCKKNKFPILFDYTDDIIESPYPVITNLNLTTFKEGVLEGISLFLKEEYRELAYPNGNTDIQMMKDIQFNNPSGKKIFDVGTYVGASALIFSKFVGKNGEVLAFEPNPFNRNRCLLNISQNPKFSQNISIFPYALGNDNKEDKMVLSSEIDNGYSSTSRLKGSHSTLRDSELPAGFEEVDVQVKTLDDFVKESKKIPDILKVDIEGAEYNFLLGALETIRKYKPIFYIEIHSEFCAIKCFEILRSEGYSVTIINEESDNRVMVKAEYNGKKERISIEDIQSRVIRNQDATFGVLNSVNALVAEIKKNNPVMDNTLKELKEEKEDLISINSRLKQRQIELEVIISSLENSKSWKLTKPFRNLISIIKKEKK